MLTVSEAKKIGRDACIEKIGRAFVEKHKENSVAAYGDFSDEGIVFCYIGVSDKPFTDTYSGSLILSEEKNRKMPYGASCNVHLEDGNIEFMECHLPQTKNYKLILWDLDGTLADTSEGVINAVKYAAKCKGLPVLPEEQYRKFIGPPNTETYGKYFGLSGEDLAEAIKFHKEYATTRGANEAKVYPGIREVLTEIKATGKQQAVVTLKLQESAEKVMNFLGLKDHFDCMIGSSPEIHEKKLLLEKCIADRKVDKAECVLIGDSIYDQIGAQACGIDFIAVTYGFGFSSVEDTKEYPVAAVATTPEDVLKFVERNAE